MVLLPKSLYSATTREVPSLKICPVPGKSTIIIGTYIKATFFSLSSFVLAIHTPYRSWNLNLIIFRWCFAEGSHEMYLDL